MPTPARSIGPTDLDLEFAQFEEAANAVPATPGFRLFDIRQVLAILQANALLIVAILLAAVGLAVVWTMIQTPLYKATATMQINDQSDRVLEKGDDTSAMMAAWDPERFLQTQLDVLKSRSLAERVEQSLKLHSDPEFFRSMGSAAPGPGVSQEAARQMAVDMIAGGLRADPPRSSRIVSVSFVSASSEQSARLANAFVKEFIAANLQRKYDSSAYARSFIADQLAQTKQRLETSEQALNGYARQADLLRTTVTIGKDGNSQEQTITSANLGQLNTAANDARSARIAAEAKWRAFSNSPPLATPEVLSDSSIKTLLANRAELRAKLQLERSRHLDGHPSIIQLQAQADEADRQINALIGTIRSSVRGQYQAAVDTERDLQRQVDKLKSQAMDEGDRSVQYNILAREVSTNRTLYDGLLQRYKELNAAAGISVSNISMIDPATPPGGPFSPNLFVNVLTALFLGAGIAGLLVLLRVIVDDTIRVPEDIEHKLHLPMLGIIPTAAEATNEALADPKSPLSEAYNSLAGSLLYSTSEGLPKVLLVTSSQSAEGKSTTSYAIAANFARLAKRVVLVDADLRRPSLHKRLDISNDKGMTSLLISNDPIDSVLTATSLPGLSVITSGPLPPSPTVLIGSNRMQAVLAQLANEFDLVVIDSPPVLGLADAPLLAALADGVVLVIEADRGRRGTLKLALRRLRAMRPVILGAILTKFDVTKPIHRYYSNDEYYQYGTEDETSRRRWRSR